MSSGRTTTTSSANLSPTQELIQGQQARVAGTQGDIADIGAPSITDMIKALFGGDPSAFDPMRRSVEGIYGTSSQYLAPIKSSVAQAKERILNTMQPGGRRDMMLAQIEAEGAVAEGQGQQAQQDRINQQVGAIAMQPLDLLYAILSGQPTLQGVGQTSTQTANPGTMSTIGQILGMGGTAAGIGASVYIL